jgi:tetratricopeptide (TPR) repeat protein/cellulose biosynthesis protein BcsQ
MTAPPARPGRIISFYSYKGGTGRTMALANVAWVLASNGERVLVVDWDLEAPGLHRYLHPFLVDRELSRSEGLIDCIIDYTTETTTRPADPNAPSQDWARRYANILRYTASLKGTFQGLGRLDFLGAGRQDAAYSTKVNTFDWKAFYERHGGGAFLELVKERMHQEYDYVLIDSRTGVSDTSGICTLGMPDDLVICFTLNNQSIVGASQVANSAREHRRNPDYRIFPVPTRVEQGEKDKLELRRRYARQRFALLPSHLSPADRERYWGEVEFLYVPFYAYEEVLAPFAEEPGRTTSLLASTERLTGYLTNGLVSRLVPPEEGERRRVLELYARAGTEEPGEGALEPRANTVLDRLSTADQAVARRLFLRLVRVPTPGENIGETAVRVPLASLDEAGTRVAQAFGAAELLVFESGDKEPAVRIRAVALIQEWRKLRQWIEEEREFLVWRQKLATDLADWERNKRDDGALLGGAPLRVARKWRDQRARDLTPEELAYIQASIAGRNLTRFGRGLVLLIVLTVFGYQAYQAFKERHRSRTTDAVVLLLEGDTLAAHGAIDSALSRYNQAIALAPDLPQGYVSRGQLYDGMGDTTAALADYAHALTLDDTLSSAYFARAQLFLREGFNQRAIRDLSLGLARDSTNTQALQLRGAVYETTGRLDSAVVDLSRAIRLDSTVAGARLARGVVYTRMGFRDSAAADYRRVLTSFTDAQDSVLAAARLRQLGVRPESTTVATVNRVYLHYSDRQDRAAVAIVAKSLAGKGWRIEGTELRPERTAGDIRYFFPVDQRRAVQLGSDIELTLAQHGVRLKLRVRYLDPKEFSLSPLHGHLEAWLPSLSANPTQAF